ncbi:MAG TPA: DUF3185 family protein [Opitutus sp.]|nr:DUF3185 family protein [Opitutus sp.]
MHRLLGLVFLVVGVVLLYYGWQSHVVAAAPMDFTALSVREPASRPIWLLGLGTVTAVWGLYSLLRRNAF